MLPVERPLGRGRHGEAEKRCMHAKLDTLACVRIDRQYRRLTSIYRQPTQASELSFWQLAPNLLPPDAADILYH